MTILNKGKTAILAAVFAGVGLSASMSQAYIIEDDWDLNLALLNGTTVGTTTIAGMADTIGIDEIIISGASTVVQQVVGGSAIGQTFTDSGVLQFTAWSPEAGGLDQFFTLGNMPGLYLEFINLTGVLNADGSITFDEGSGTVKLWLDSDTDGNSATGDTLELADFKVIPPSGGSDLDFIGGAGANATIDVTLEVVSTWADGLFTDENGDDLGSMFFAFVNTDSKLDGDFCTDGSTSGPCEGNPDDSGVDAQGNGPVIINVNNAGQFNIATIPEPASLSLFGLGLLGLSAITRRRRIRK